MEGSRNTSPLALSLMSACCLCCWPPQPQYLQAWDRFSPRSKAHSPFHSLPSPSPTTAPNPSSLDWFPLTMTFLHMPSSHDGAVGSSWLSADFRAPCFIRRRLNHKSWDSGAKTPNGAQLHLCGIENNVDHFKDSLLRFKYPDVYVNL